MMWRFELFQDSAYQSLWFWRLVDGHGNPLAKSLKGATSFESCLENLRRLGNVFSYTPVVAIVSATAISNIDQERP